MNDSSCFVGSFGLGDDPHEACYTEAMALVTMLRRCISLMDDIYVPSDSEDHDVRLLVREIEQLIQEYPA